MKRMEALKRWERSNERRRRVSNKRNNVKGTETKSWSEREEVTSGMKKSWSERKEVMNGREELLRKGRCNEMEDFKGQGGQDEQERRVEVKGRRWRNERLETKGKGKRTGWNSWKEGRVVLEWTPWNERKRYMNRMKRWGGSKKRSRSLNEMSDVGNRREEETKGKSNERHALDASLVTCRETLKFLLMLPSWPSPEACPARPWR